MKDQLSALIDGEFEIAESEHLLTSAKSGGELKQAWAHYHLIGDAMRGELGRGELGRGELGRGELGRGELGRGKLGRGVALSQDFTSRVMAAIDAEPTVLMPSKPVQEAAAEASNVTQIASKKALYKTSRIWSVAASAAAVMFVGAMVVQQQWHLPQQAIIVKTEKVAPVQAVAQVAALTPVEIAQSVPTEYLEAHQAAAPTSTAYYIQDASFAGSGTGSSK